MSDSSSVSLRNTLQRIVGHLCRQRRLAREQARIDAQAEDVAVQEKVSAQAKRSLQEQLRIADIKNVRARQPLHPGGFECDVAVPRPAGHRHMPKPGKMAVIAEHLRVRGRQSRLNRVGIADDAGRLASSRKRGHHRHPPVHQFEFQEFERAGDDPGRAQVGEMIAGLRDEAIARRMLCDRYSSSTHQLVMLQKRSGRPRTMRSA